MFQSMFKRVIIGFMCALTIAGCSKGNNNKQSPPATNTAASDGNAPVLPVLGETKVLSTVDKLPDGASGEPNQRHTISNYVVAFSSLGRGVAYVAEEGGQERVVHNGKPGPMHEGISHLTISPDGQRISYRCTLLSKQQPVTDGVPRQVFDNVRDFSYTPDSRHLAYLTTSGGRMGLVLDEKIFDENVEFGLLYFTNDSKNIVYARGRERDGTSQLVIVDLKTGARSIKDCLASTAAVNRTSNRISVVIKDGDKRRLMDFLPTEPDKVRISSPYDGIVSMSFTDDGKSFAFIALKGKDIYMVMNGREELIPPGLAIYGSPQIRPDLKGAGIILATPDRYNRSYIFHQSMHGDSLPKKWYQKINELVYSKINSTSAYAAMMDGKWFMVVNGKEGPRFDMIVTPMFSPDGSKLVYRAREGDRRFVVVADVNGKDHRRQAEYEMVTQPVFIDNGKSIAYGVKDGDKLVWKVERL